MGQQVHSHRLFRDRSPDVLFLSIGWKVMEKEVVYVAEHIRMHKIDWLAVNGGFVRANIATFELDKFKGKNAFCTFNLNYDVAASDAVLRADEEHISHIVLVGKNVCHDARNTEMASGVEKIQGIVR